VVKTLYRVLRDPIVFFLVLPFIKFFFFHRFDYMLFSYLQKYNYGKELGHFVFNTVVHNVGLILLSKTLYEIGVLHHYMVSMYLATVFGTALFHNQHCFNPPYVVKKEEWSFSESGLKGSSHILVPPFLKYFTNGIEFHHIHHMMPRIAGHCLEKCHDFIHEWKPEMLKDVHRLSLRDCFHNMKYTLYDAESKQFVSFYTFAP
jgi:omega-6 fatty acid desaturase (delta-12 desaturase)